MNLSVWDLIKEHRFEEACIKADAEFAETSSLLALRNKIFALLLLSNYSEAIDQGKEIILLNKGETDSDFVFCGVAYWLTGLKNEAVAMWTEARKKYTDAAGGVEVELLLFYASVEKNDEKLRQEVLKVLKKKIKSGSIGPWPAPLGAYILGLIDEAELKEKMSAVPLLRLKHQCQADFHIGVVQKMRGQPGESQASMRQCSDLGPVTYTKAEFYLGSWESRELNSSLS